MPGIIIEKYEQVPETKAELEWAEFATLDLSLYDQPGGKEQLVKQLYHAVHHVGFFYVKNFNISQEEVDRQFALGREFYSLPLDEKLKYHNLADLEGGEYNGYKPAGLRKVANGIKDNIQVYNIPKFDGHHKRQHPEVLQENIKEVEDFSRKCHKEVVTKLLRLFAILLELPDQDQLARDHAYDERGEDHLRYMHYAARPAADNAKVADLYVPGHTDLGSLTLLFRQPVAALQVQAADGSWRWVKPQDGTITINTADALTALTGGYIKSSVHRVHAPPPDQADVDRLGVLYFSRPNNHVVLDPITNSPLLKRLGYNTNALTQVSQHLTTEQWVKVRQTQQQRPVKEAKIDASGNYTYDEKDLEIVPGLHDKIHN